MNFLFLILGFGLGFGSLVAVSLWYMKRMDKKIEPKKDELMALVNQVKDSVELYSNSIVEVSNIVHDTTKTDSEIVSELRGFFVQWIYIAEQYGIIVSPKDGKK